MWKLKIAEGSGSPYVFSTNNFIGRQFWEYDPNHGTPEERSQVENARKKYHENRFEVKPSSDFLMQLQLMKENEFDQTRMPAAVKVKNNEEVSHESARTALKRAAHFCSAMQASDGHWPAESSGALFLLPPLIMVLYITGTMDTVLSSEHKKEMLRYIYNHQNEDGGWGLHIEHPSTMFGTALNYIALRLLGEPRGGLVEKAQIWILDHGGVALIPSWGKTMVVSGHGQCR
ncbi:Terpene cyclase/mutase family member [Thalictrum thalictroides]|uniref:Terpene cyclase/mutase family member n=1 Tax=Thalictrum thalictroides TaxID=46969 RepID=A0A7J6V720_THATH|nr:Terpene cyclase/mutase family member [Thalictrum thalictroides]